MTCAGYLTATHAALLRIHDHYKEVLPKYGQWKGVTELIDEYVYNFRPTLLRGRNEDFLFPGQRQGSKDEVSFSGQITKRIYKATGLRMTVHLFRHAAGALILKHRPGEYELVRQLLGHRNVQTTINSYIGLETIQASRDVLLFKVRTHLLPKASGPILRCLLG
jgi:integrase